MTFFRLIKTKIQLIWFISLKFLIDISYIFIYILNNLTHSATGSFFSSLSSLSFAALLARGELVWTPWDVTSGPRFCSATADEGDSEGVPVLLPVGPTLRWMGVEASSHAEDSVETLDPVESPAFLSACWSFGFSPRSRWALVNMGSKTGSGFELDCNFKIMAWLKWRLSINV